MPLYRLFSVFVICCALTIAGCSKSSTEAGLEKEDLDGDGIGNIYDPDIDGDGKPNGKDPDPENNDPNYCDRIQVYGLNDEQTTGSEIVLTWNLQSSKTNDENCVVKEGVKADLIQVTASAVGAADTKSEQTNPLARAATRIQIPLACTGETVEVTYDFTEIATLIKADPKAAGWTVEQRHKADPEACDFDGDGAPDFGVQCPAEATGAYPSCSCPTGEGYDLSSNACLDISGGVGSGPIQLCPAEATGAYPDCSCPAGQNYNEDTNECDQKPNECEQDNHDDCITERRMDYLDCLRRCDSSYCSEQCGELFKIACTDCNDCFSTERPAICRSESLGIATVPDPDVDGDGIPNDSDSDVDGDGIPNTSDKDIDGDGIWNKDDLDIDGDGKINSIDPDADGDGTPDAEDDTPGGPR